VDGFDGPLFENKTRAFLQVQNGCDHRCTFCIIPFGRGPSRSVGMGEVVAEARRLTGLGFAEIVLTGVDITSYGTDLPYGSGPGRPSLGALVQKILKLVPELKRLRLSSLDPAMADPLLLAAIAEEERLMPHFHLSAQSGDDLILKRMKRRHGRADIIGFCRTVRRVRPDAAFGADLIAGFPTESEAMFENTLSLADEAGLSFLHVFPFSPRNGTPAAKMPPVDRAAIKHRARRLREKGAHVLAARLQRLIGTEQELLVEEPGTARTACFAPVRLSGNATPGQLLHGRIEASDGRILDARVLEPARKMVTQAIA